MDRLTRNAGGVVTLLTYDSAGTPLDLAEVPAVVIADGAGTEVATGAATRTAEGTYTFTVTPAQTATCDVYEVTWTSGGDQRTTRYEVTGGPLCSIADIRGSDRALAQAAATTLIDARDRATERFERAARTAYSMRGRRETLTGTGNGRLIPSRLDIRNVVSVEVDGEAWTGVTIATGDVLKAPDGLIWPKGSTVELHYEYGLDDVPEPVRGAIVALAKTYAVPSGLPERATALATDAGSFRMTIAGRDGFTGLPEVDEVIREFGKPAPAVGGVSW